MGGRYASYKNDQPIQAGYGSPAPPAVSSDFTAILLLDIRRKQFPQGLRLIYGALY